MTQISRWVLMFILLMFSPAFKGILIIMAVVFEGLTTSLGLAPVVFKRMGLAIGQGGADEVAAAWFAICVCIFFALLLTWSISVASFHKRKVSTIILSILSAVISFRGVAGDAYASVSGIDSFTLELWLDTVYYLAFSVSPLIYVTMNSDLIVLQFQAQLSNALKLFNKEMGQWLEDYVSKNMQTANTILDVETTKKQSKANRRRSKTSPQNEYKQEEKGETVLDYTQYLN